MRSALVGLAAAVASVAGLTIGIGAAGAQGPSAQGVTPTTIKVGVTYPDLSALRGEINVDPGNYPVAYQALFDQINARGGIDGRKVVPVFAGVNPLGTAGAATACTQLTEDDKVFAVLGFFQLPDTACYVQTHGVPIIGQSLTAQQAAQAKAPWFNDLISPSDLVPKEMTTFAQEGVFKGKKVGVVATSVDQDELALVSSALRAHHVNVVQSAVNSVPDTDNAAQVQEYGVIAQKFQSSGVDLVVAVGNSGNGWPAALQGNQSTYTPQLVATDYNDLHAYTANKAGYSQAVLRGALTAGGDPPASVWWNTPAMKSCLATVHQAEPTATINDPVTATASTPVTWTAPETACYQVALFADIAKAAGKTLNVGTFAKGGASLTHVVLPGGGGTYDFAGGHNDGNGPVFVYTWSPAARALVLQSTVG